MDVNAVINARDGDDDGNQLAAGAAGADRLDGDAARAAALGRAVAAGDARDRGSGAVHLAAADDGRRVRAVHRVDAPRARGRQLRLLRRGAARDGHRDRDLPGPAARAGLRDGRVGLRHRVRVLGHGRCSSTARRWSSTSRSTSSARTASRRAPRSPTDAATARCARSARCRKASCGSRSCATASISTRRSGRFSTRTGAARSRSGVRAFTKTAATSRRGWRASRGWPASCRRRTCPLPAFFCTTTSPVDSVRGRPLRCQSMTLAAVFPPMPTPFDDGEVDAKAVSANVARWIARRAGRRRRARHQRRSARCSTRTNRTA